MKVKVSFVFLSIVMLILSYIIPLNSGIVEETDPHALRTMNGVTAMNDFFAFFDEENQHEIVIEISNTELDALDEQMKKHYETYGNYRSNVNVKADFIYKENDIVKYTILNIGFRSNGNGKNLGLIDYKDHQVNVNNYRLTFDETFDYEPQTAEFNQLENRTFLGMDKLNLKFNKTGIEESVTSHPYVNEAYAYELFRQVGVIAPEATLALITLKVGYRELSLGLYTVIENIDQKFINKRFSNKENDGNLYKCLYRQGVYANLTLFDSDFIGIENEDEDFYPPYDMKTNTKSNDGTDLIAFTENLSQMNGSSLRIYLDAVLDIDPFLRYLAMSFLIGNIDDFRFRGNNYYLYFDSKQNQIHLFPQDLDYVFGQYGELAYFDEHFATIDPYSSFTIMDKANVLLTKTLLSQDPAFASYRSTYESYLKTFSEEIFTYGNYIDYYYEVLHSYQGDEVTNDVRTTFPTMGIGSTVSSFYRLKRSTVSEVLA